MPDPFCPPFSMVYRILPYSSGETAEQGEGWYGTVLGLCHRGHRELDGLADLVHQAFQPGALLRRNTSARQQRPRRQKVLRRIAVSAATGEPAGAVQLSRNQGTQLLVCFGAKPSQRGLHRFLHNCLLA